MHNLYIEPTLAKFTVQPGLLPTKICAETCDISSKVFVFLFYDSFGPFLVQYFEFRDILGPPSEHSMFCLYPKTFTIHFLHSKNAVQGCKMANKMGCPNATLALLFF